jgi:hypothetical protein
MSACLLSFIIAVLYSVKNIMPDFPGLSTIDEGEHRQIRTACFSGNQYDWFPVPGLAGQPCFRGLFLLPELNQIVGI